MGLCKLNGTTLKRKLKNLAAQISGEIQYETFLVSRFPKSLMLQGALDFLAFCDVFVM
jgi:hypothetical protein